MQLRPHHLLDIISAHGCGDEFKPHPYGHSVHTVASAVLSNPDLKVEFTVGADAVCQGCKHLLPNGLCDDVLTKFSPPISKQKYNDDLDRRLFAYMKFEPGTAMAVRQFFDMVNKRTPGIEKIRTHPTGDAKRRLKDIIEGLRKLGIRKNNNM